VPTYLKQVVNPCWFSPVEIRHPYNFFEIGGTRPALHVLPHLDIC